MNIRRHHLLDLGHRYLALKNTNQFPQIENRGNAKVTSLPYVDDSLVLRQTPDGIMVDGCWGRIRTVEDMPEVLQNYFIIEEGAQSCSVLVIYAKNGPKLIISSVHIPSGTLPGKIIDEYDHYRHVVEWVRT